MQLSVPRYQAIALGRGANLDAIDFALSNRVWLKNQITQIRTLPDEKARQARIAQIVDWTNPGPGGFYDDLGDTHANLTSYKRALHAGSRLLKSPLTGFGSMPQQARVVSWFTDTETLGDTPLRMRYTDLDRTAQYAIRVVYGGGTPNAQMRLVANGKVEIMAFARSRDPSRRSNSTFRTKRPPAAN